MSEYRAYIIGADGHISNFRAFAAETDADAIVWAKQLVDGHDVELWSGPRLVERLPNVPRAAPRNNRNEHFSDEGQQSFGSIGANRGYPSPCFNSIVPSGHRTVNKPEENTPVPDTKPYRSEQARRIIEEYGNDQREIIKKLRRTLD